MANPTTPDARLLCTFPTHNKTKKLRRRLGEAGPWALVCLWLWAAGERPDGDLDGLSDEDVELNADWNGDAGALVACLRELRFLDGQEGSYRLHDWAEHNPWLCGAQARSEKARWAALVRRYGRDEAARSMPDYAERLLRAEAERASSRENSGSSTAPSPEPVPVPIPKPAPTQTKRRARAPAVGSEPYSTGFLQFWDAYPDGKRSKKLDAWKVWERDKLDDFTETIVQDVQRRKAEHWDWLKDGGKYIPGAQVYLNGRRWNDDITEPPRVAGRRSETEQANANTAGAWVGELG